MPPPMARPPRPRLRTKARPDIVRQFELTEKVHAYDPKADTGLIDAAYVLAMKAHGNQKRDNGDPYITHPLAVADILAGYRLDTASHRHGLLHDTIEDTTVKLREIAGDSARRSPAWSTASRSSPGWNSSRTAPSRPRTSANSSWP